MNGTFKGHPASWLKGADAFEKTGTSATSALSQLVSQTTDAAACGAAKGLATVDGAVAVMLSVFGEVMQNDVLTNLQEGLAAEAEQMDKTGAAIKKQEQHAIDQQQGMVS